MTSIRPQDFDLSVGIDTCKASYAITYTDHDRKMKSLFMPAKPESLLRYFQRQFPQKRLLYLYEAGPTGYALHDYLKAQNQTCLVVHPASVAQACNQRVKNNRLDSRKLSQQGLSGELQGIRVPEDAYRQLRHLVNPNAFHKQRYLIQRRSQDLWRKMWIHHVRINRRRIQPIAVSRAHSPRSATALLSSSLTNPSDVVP